MMLCWNACTLKDNILSNGWEYQITGFRGSNPFSFAYAMNNSFRASGSCHDSKWGKKHKRVKAREKESLKQRETKMQKKKKAYVW
jgi:hypothetical protein